MEGTTRPERQSRLLQFVTGTTRASRIYIVQTERGVSQLRTQAIRTNRRRVMSPLIVLTCHPYKDYASLEYLTLAVKSISLTSPLEGVPTVGQ
jgi:hypothetical protein